MNNRKRLREWADREVEVVRERKGRRDCERETGREKIGREVLRESDREK